jgi:hypothetical protein
MSALPPRIGRQSKARIIPIHFDAASFKGISLRFDGFEDARAAAPNSDQSLLNKTDGPLAIERHIRIEGCQVASASFSEARQHGRAGLDLGDDIEPWQDRQTLSFLFSQRLAVLTWPPVFTPS